MLVDWAIRNQAPLILLKEQKKRKEKKNKKGEGSTTVRHAAQAEYTV
jgi:hypothetical protein